MAGLRGERNNGLCSWSLRGSTSGLSKGPQDWPPCQREGALLFWVGRPQFLRVSQAQSHVLRDTSPCKQDKGPWTRGRPNKSIASCSQSWHPWGGLQWACVLRGQGEDKSWGRHQMPFHLLVEQDVVLGTQAKALPYFIQAGFNVLSPNEHGPWCRRQQTRQDGPAKHRSQWQKGWPLGAPRDGSPDSQSDSCPIKANYH